MTRYFKGIMTGGIIGAALGLYFLFRSKRVNNVMNVIRFRGQTPRNARNVADKKVKGLAFRKGNRVFAKRLVR